jgi:DNA-binding response OmpR family regulator
MPEKKAISKILILEDEPVISKILFRTFKAADIVADTAGNGLIAKEKIDSGEKYDAFLFDIRTPVISGIQLYEYLEKKYPDLTRKVVFMTGDCLSAVTSSFLNRVKRPYIIKPFAPNEIIELLKPILRPETTAA